MPNHEIKTRFRLEGEQQFSAAMKDAANAQKLLNAEMNLAKATFESTGDAEEYAAESARILRDQINEQKKAVDAAEQAMKQLGTRTEENGKKYDTWKGKLLNAQTRLVHLEGQLKNAQTEFDNTDKKANDSDLAKGINFQNTIKAIDEITGAIETVIKTAFRAAKALWDMGVDAGKWAKDLTASSKKLGVDPETYQSWQYAAGVIGTTVDDIKNGWDALGNKLNSDQAGDQFRQLNEDMSKLHVGLRNQKGDLKNSRDLFWDVVDALRAMGTEAQYGETANKLFGGNWRNLIPLIERGSLGFHALALEGKQTASVSNENVKALTEFGNKADKVNTQLNTLKYDTLAALAPTFNDVADALSKAISAMDDFVQSEEGRAALQGLNEALSGLIKSFLGEDNGKETFASIVNTAKEAVSGFTTALEWIKDNGNSVAGIILSMVSAWAGLKVVKGAMEMFQIGKAGVSGAKNLFNGGKNLLSNLFGGKSASAESLDDVAKSFSDTAERFSDTADAFDAAADSAKQSAEAAKSSSEAAKSASESASSASEAASSSSEAASSSSESASSSSKAAESASDTASSNASAASSSAEAASSSADAASSSAEAAASSAEAAGSSATAAGNSEAAAAASGDAAALSASAADQAALAAGSSADAAASSALAAGSSADAAASSALTAGSAADASLGALTAAGDSVLASGNSAAAALESADAAASSALASGSALDAAISAAEAAATSIETAANAAASAAESALGAASSRAALEAELAGAAAARSLAEAAAARAIASANAAALNAAGSAGSALLNGGGQALLGAGGPALLGSGPSPLALPPAGGASPGFTPTLGAGMASASELLGGVASLAGFTYAWEKAIEARRGDQSKLVDTAEHLAAATEGDKALKAAFEEYVKTQREMEEADYAYFGGEITDKQFEEIINKATEASKAFLDMKDSEKVLDAYNSWRAGNSINNFDWILPDNWEELGLGATDGLTSGLEQGTSDVETAAKDLGNAVIDAAKGALDEHSPSREMEIIGENASVGLANGIYNRADEAIQAAQWLADQVAATFQNALDIHSPSGVFEDFGEFTGIGYAGGVEKSLARVEQAVGKMVTAATSRPVQMLGGMPYGAAYAQSAQAAGRSASGASPSDMLHVTLQVDGEDLADIMAPLINGKIGAIVQATRR